MSKGIALRALLALGFIGTALLTHAQAPQSVPHIGVLDPSAAETSLARLQGIRAGLKSRGLEEGRHYVIDYRSAEGRFGPPRWLFDTSFSSDMVLRGWHLRLVLSDVMFV